MKRRVLVDVDTQHDFCEPSGALFVAGSPCDAFRALVAHAVATGTPIVGSVDSHAFDAWEFASSGRTGPRGEAPRFPDHCVKGTPGWLKVRGTLPPRFRFVPRATVELEPLVGELARGESHAVYFEKEVYSLFENPMAGPFVDGLTRALGADVAYVVFGVATDYCVRAAALGLLERGLETWLVTDAIAAVDAEGGARAQAELEARGVRAARVAEVLAGGRA